MCECSKYSKVETYWFFFSLLKRSPFPCWSKCSLFQCWSKCSSFPCWSKFSPFPFGQSFLVSHGFPMFGQVFYIPIFICMCSVYGKINSPLMKLIFLCPFPNSNVHSLSLTFSLTSMLLPLLPLCLHFTFSFTPL